MLETGENLYHFLYFSYWLDLTSILAWRIPWTEEPGRPWGRKELDTTEQLLDDVWDLTDNSIVNPDMITFWVVKTRR